MGDQEWLSRGLGAEGEERAELGNIAGEEEGLGWGRMWRCERGRKVSTPPTSADHQGLYLLSLACLSWGFPESTWHTPPCAPSPLPWGSAWNHVPAFSWTLLGSGLCVSESRNRPWVSKTSRQGPALGVSQHHRVRHTWLHGSSGLASLCDCQGDLAFPVRNLSCPGSGVHISASFF